MKLHYFVTVIQHFHLDVHLKQSCLVCLSAVLTVNAPLTEVIETMQETRLISVQTFDQTSATSINLSRPPVCTSEASVKSSEPSACTPERSARTSEQVPRAAKTTPRNSECAFPWLVCECFTILETSSTDSYVGDVSEDEISTLRSEVLLLLIVFVRNYFTLLRYVSSMTF